MRSNQIVKALTQPLTVKGCAYEFFTSAIALALVFMFILMVTKHSGTGIFGGLAVFGGVFSLGKHLTKKDPQYLTIMLARVNRWRNLDPKKRNLRSLHIKMEE